ncbi:DinB family protein [Crocinitomix sp.]|nr:DinB family protein [Crocinitomix sp.]
MKTFKEMNANGNILTNKALDQFLTDQEQLLELLDAASALNLTKIKTAISISKLIKLRLGDTFRVVVYHNQRHLEQAKRAISF